MTITCNWKGKHEIFTHIYENIKVQNIKRLSIYCQRILDHMNEIQLSSLGDNSTAILLVNVSSHC